MTAAALQVIGTCTARKHVVIFIADQGIGQTGTDHVLDVNKRVAVAAGECVGRVDDTKINRDSR